MYANWFYRAEAKLEEALSNGRISKKEFTDEMRELRAILNEQAEKAAEQAALEWYICQRDYLQ